MAEGTSRIRGLCTTNRGLATIKSGQGAAADISAQPEVVELGGMGPQAGFDVAHACAGGHLREGHAEKLARQLKVRALK